MKKIVFIICAVFAGLAANAQTSIGKVAPADGSGILDFNAGGKSGIVLPWVSTLPTGAALAGGVLIYDTNLKKVMYYNGTAWVDLSLASGTAVDLSIQNGVPESTIKGAVIGAQSSTTDGVLVLESSSMALILPKVVSPHLNIVKPLAGTICYDTVKNLVCVYNGSDWTFWK
ncbi:hypothetical protein [Flavobacterium reichenbachii]|uniref:Uncharacterized protein n=1 Tax=Flavobacterium reichenbachii TaxID=362418 RepID=A0A085ZIL2_9FLAO|nr:hypothetical protein [Flavobacterium reichenbachii]KFF04276.1 hypothetical protein IW19_01480 [Flavobacterium reichenbachii]OXB13828.1 hypothetical protein B0A68_13840 [Flavobacterium reichenbachii]